MQISAKQLYRLKRVLFTVSEPLRKIVYFGKSKYCPVCKSSIRGFVTTKGLVRRNNARCPVCWSLERHRFVWLFLQRKTNLFDNLQKRILHVAPELVFQSKFQKILNLEYISADLTSPRATVKMDITQIQFSERYFDIIYCSHVLEHVIDDRKAMKEFYRVLKPNGWALLLIPITSETTFEDFTITDPNERKRIFGHPEHVRNYGLDFVDRLAESGFIVNVYSSESLFEKNDIDKMGLLKNERIFLCKKS